MIPRPTYLTLHLFRWASGLLLASVAVGAEPPAGPPFPRIANVYGTAVTSDGGSFHGAKVALEDVAKYDLLIGVRRPQGNAQSDLFRKQLEKLKKFNPHLNALHFACSAPYTRIAPPDEILDSRKPDQVTPWLLQTDGTPIAGWPGTYMLNLAAPDVVEWLAQQTAPAVHEIGYDGVFIDCMGPHFDTWACEIASGKPYTVDYNADREADDREQLKKIWTDAKTTLARRTRELLGKSAIFMANQAGPSTYDQLNGIYLEDYVDAILDRGMSWEKVLEKYLRWTKTPRRPNVTVLGCSSGIEPPFEAFKLTPKERAKYLQRGKPKHQRMRFGLATTLMGDGYYSFDLHTRWRGQFWWYPEFDAPLGYPRGPCERNLDGTWSRRFDGGVVVVNPTQWDATVLLDRIHRDVSSGQVDRRFLLPRLDGRIYLSSDGPTRPGTLPPAEPQLTTTGPAGVLARDGNLVLRDGQGMAILVGPAGAIMSLCVDEQELIDSIGTVIVKDDKWQNFDTGALHHQVEADGALTLTGTRTDGDLILHFRQTIQLADGRLELKYRWRAKTPLELKAFRQNVRLPPRVFAGTKLRSGDNEVLLPKEMAASPDLGKVISSATLPIGDSKSVTIRLPQTAQVVDNRHYNGSGFLLTFYPIAGEIETDRQWSYAIKIIVDRPGSSHRAEPIGRQEPDLSPASTAK